MTYDLDHLFAFFTHRSSLNQSDLIEPMHPVYQEGMEVLEDIGFVSCYRTRDGKISTSVLTELGEAKVKELVRR